MRIYGLLGYPLSHSFSENYFLNKFKEEQRSDCDYRNFSFENPEDAVSFLRSLPGLEGFNITIPYKESVIPFLDRFSEIVARIHSCNCVRVENGKWTGYNTDIIGFEKSLTPLLKPSHSKALIFGTGGASKAVGFVLDNLGLSCLFVSRKKRPGQIQYEEVTPGLLKEYTLLVNTTPVGMFPETGKFLPIPYDCITSEHLVYDLIYNPQETLFLKKSRVQGAVTKNGYEMLLIQADESWKIWNEDNSDKQFR